MKNSNSKPDLDLSRAELNARLDALRQETTPRRTFLGRFFAVFAGFFALLTLGCKKWGQPLCYSQPCPESQRPEPSESDDENQPLCYEPPELPPEDPEGEQNPEGEQKPEGEETPEENSKDE